MNPRKLVNFTVQFDNETEEDWRIDWTNWECPSLIISDNKIINDGNASPNQVKI